MDTDTTTGTGTGTVRQSAEVRAIVSTWPGLLEAAGVQTKEVLRRVSFGSSTWSRILSDKYGAEFTAEKARQTDAILRELCDAKLSGKTVVGRGEVFLEFAEHRMLKAAVEKARAAVLGADEHRLVWFVARPGFGKDATQEWLAQADPNVVRVNARPSWKGSYLAVLHALCEAVGLDVYRTEERRSGKVRRCVLWNVRLAEEALFDRLKEKTFTICLNEVSQMSGALLSLIKGLVNDTRSVVCVFCTPEYYRLIMASANRLGERDHLTRRSAGGLIELREVSAEQVLKFAEAMGVSRLTTLADAVWQSRGWQLTGEVLSAQVWAERIAAEARMFAGFDLVRAALAGIAAKGTAADWSTVQQALTVFRGADHAGRKSPGGRGRRA